MWIACSLQFDYFTAGSQSEKAAGGELSEGMVLESINGVSQAGLPYDDVRQLGYVVQCGVRSNRTMHFGRWWKRM